MSIREAAIEDDPAGNRPAGDGWFVLTCVGARGFGTPGHGVFCPFEAPDARFPEYGINVHVLQPGERSALYHHEDAQEDFLVLAGECVAVVEEQERTLRQWDFLHCPAGHGARLRRRRRRPVRDPDDRLARARDGDDEYPVSEAAARHGLSAPVPTDGAREAYERRGLAARERRDADALAGRRPALGRGAQRQLAGGRGERRARGRRAARPRSARARATPAIDSSSARSSAAVSGGASGSACAACTRSAPPWRSALRSTRATSRSPSRNGST